MRPEAKTFRASDGSELTFLFDFPAMIAAEDAADKPFDQVVRGALAGRIGHLGALIHGGLKRLQPGTTLASALALIESDGEAVGKAMWPALWSAMPEQKDAGQNPPKPRGGTGSRSSAAGSRKGSEKKPSGGKRPAASQRS